MPNTDQLYDYGKCDICNTPLEEQYITQDFWIKGELIVIEHVRAGVCPQCGEKIVNAEVGQQILELLQQPEYRVTARHINVPVFSFKEYLPKVVHA